MALDIVLDGERWTFIYALADSRPGGGIRYVGKSNRPYERVKQHVLPHLNIDNVQKNLWLRELRDSHNSPRVIIIEAVPLDSWQDAEIKWIARLRAEGHDLTNTMNGGNGSRFVSEEARQKISAAQKGRVRTPETIAKLRRSLTGRIIPPETRAKMGVSRRGVPRPAHVIAKISAGLMGKRKGCVGPMRGKKHTEATKLKMRTTVRKKRTGPSPLIGKHPSEATRAKLRAKRLAQPPPTKEQRAKISAKLMGHPVSAESIAKTRAANLGRKHTPKSVANMSAAQFARHKRRRDAGIVGYANSTRRRHQPLPSPASLPISPEPNEAKENRVFLF